MHLITKEWNEIHKLVGNFQYIWDVFMGEEVQEPPPQNHWHNKLYK